MVRKQLAIAAALLGIATPSLGFDSRNEPTAVMFYYAIPLDAKTKKENVSWYGMQFNSKRDFQAYNVDLDSRVFRPQLAEGGSTAASLLLIGGVAVGGAVLGAGRCKRAQR